MQGAFSGRIIYDGMAMSSFTEIKATQQLDLKNMAVRSRKWCNSGAFAFDGRIIDLDFRTNQLDCNIRL